MHRTSTAQDILRGSTDTEAAQAQAKGQKHMQMQTATTEQEERQETYQCGWTHTVFCVTRGVNGCRQCAEACAPYHVLGWVAPCLAVVLVDGQAIAVAVRHPALLRAMGGACRGKHMSSSIQTQRVYFDEGFFLGVLLTSNRGCATCYMLHALLAPDNVFKAEVYPTQLDRLRYRDAGSSSASCSRQPGC
jgi:hypothetical protein